MEGDTEVREKPRTQNISIHSLRMEGDVLLCTGQGILRHFNPLPPHGGRLFVFRRNRVALGISIHSLRMEGDVDEQNDFAVFWIFQSTPSAWRETYKVKNQSATCVISIHSLRMEGDDVETYFLRILGHFNPLPPHGGRLDVVP